MSDLKDPVSNDITITDVLEINAKVSRAESRGQKTMSMPTETMRQIMNYIFDLEQDLRWNTSKYGVTPPLKDEEESDGRAF